MRHPHAGGHDDPAGDGQSQGFSTGGRTELNPDAGDQLGAPAAGDAQGEADFLGGQAVGDALEHLALADREVRDHCL